MKTKKTKLAALTTAAELLASKLLGQDVYYFLPELVEDAGGQRLRFSPGGPVCAGKQSTRDLVRAERGVDIPLFRDVIDSPANLRLVVAGAGPFLWVAQAGSEDRVTMPLLLRNGPVHESGKFNNAVGTVSDDPIRTTWREANEELCILWEEGRPMNNPVLRRAFFVAPEMTRAEGLAFMRSMGGTLRQQESCIRSQLPPELAGLPIRPRLVPTTSFAERNPDPTGLTIEFPGRPAYRLMAQIMKDPRRPNLNINPVAKAVLPHGRLIQVDPEGFGRETGFFALETLVRADFPKIPALDRYAAKLAAALLRPDEPSSAEPAQA